MNDEQLTKFLAAVEDRINKALEPVTAERDALKKAIEGEGTEENPGLVARLKAVEEAVTKIATEGDQTAREAISKLSDTVATVNKATIARKSIEDQETVDTSADDVKKSKEEIEKQADKNLNAALMKAILEPGKQVKIGFGA